MLGTPTMNVLLAAALPPPDAGGIITWTKALCAGLKSRSDINLSVIDMMPRYRSQTNSSLSSRLIGGSAQAMRDICKLRKQLNENAFDVFHLCSSGGLASPKDITMLRIARKAGIPTVLHYHMGRLPQIISVSGVAWKLKQKAIRLSDAVIVLDKRSEDSLKSALPNANVLRLPNMIGVANVQNFIKDNSLAPLPAVNGRMRIVYVGYVVPTKGVGELVQACSRISSDRIALEIIGPFENFYRDELRESVGGDESNSWLRFHGSLPRLDALKFIANADIFVLPSYTEGFPNVIMEAMTFGRPIISTPVGAIAEMLDVGGPEECGILVPPRNAGALHRALRDMLFMSLEELARLGQKAFERVNRVYDSSVVINRIIDLWTSLRRNN